MRARRRSTRQSLRHNDYIRFVCDCKRRTAKRRRFCLKFSGRRGCMPVVLNGNHVKAASARDGREIVLSGVKISLDKRLVFRYAVRYYHEKRVDGEKAAFGSFREPPLAVRRHGESWRHSPLSGPAEIAFALRRSLGGDGLPAVTRGTGFLRIPKGGGLSVTGGLSKRVVPRGICSPSVSLHGDGRRFYQPAQRRTPLALRRTEGEIFYETRQNFRHHAPRRGAVAGL